MSPLLVRRYGIAIADIINLLNPAFVILAGDLVEAGDLIMGPIRKRVDQGALSICREDTRIVFTELGRHIGAIGAVTVVLEKPFHSSWKD